MKKRAIRNAPIFTNNIFKDPFKSFRFFTIDAHQLEHIIRNSSISKAEADDWWEKELDAFTSVRKASDEDWMDKEVRFFIRKRNIEAILKDDGND